MILEGAMIITAVSCLTAGHPGPALGPMWQAGGFRLRGNKNANGGLKMHESPIQQVEGGEVRGKA
jgi:hypothetical protein